MTPSGLGHKYHSVSQGPGVGAVPASVGMTTGAVSQSKPFTNCWRVGFRTSGSWWYQSPVGLRAPWGLPAAYDWADRKREGNLCNPGSSSSQRRARHSGDQRTSWLSSLPSGPRGNMVWDCLQLADTGLGTNTCPRPLPVGDMAPGSMKQSIFFLTLDKSVYFRVCL